MNSKVFLQPASQATCWFCEGPLAFIYSLTISSSINLSVSVAGRFISLAGNGVQAGGGAREGGRFFESREPPWSSSWLLARDGTWCEWGPLCSWILARHLSMGRNGGGQTVPPWAEVLGSPLCPQEGQALGRPGELMAPGLELASAGGGALL